MGFFYSAVITASLIINSVCPKEYLKFLFIPKQNYETSCGLAGAAGIMDLYWNVPTTEHSLALSLPEDPENTKSGFVSLYALKNVFESKDFLVKGFSLRTEELRPLVGDFAPILVYYERPNPHFSVLLYTEDSLWVMADPARGTECLAERDFNKIYGKAVLFLVHKENSKNTSLLFRAADSALSRYKILEALSW